MSKGVRTEIQREVINYLRQKDGPVEVRSMVSELHNGKLSDVPESDLRSVVQPMIVTGKLSYASGLKIRLAETAD